MPVEQVGERLIPLLARRIEACVRTWPAGTIVTTVPPAAAPRVGLVAVSVGKGITLTEFGPRLVT
ncbi:hypothetical protein ACH4E7_41290 [Kitasatospora sp. NPDC018058]|uniref:hypothetical protein n=1 Tax=Kitasatospora sp. NPDC018058 TaxID=3364025 RepID=UPI0037C0728A